MNAGNWTLLADTGIDLAVGNVDALCRTAKLDQNVVEAFARWVSSANTAR
ncbi:hypothetical protein [Kitasatospora sp. NPDC057223]